jgi:hypothetical protein
MLKATGEVDGSGPLGLIDVYVGTLHVVEDRHEALHGFGSWALDDGQVMQQAPDRVCIEVHNAGRWQFLVCVEDLFVGRFVVFQQLL